MPHVRAAVGTLARWTVSNGSRQKERFLLDCPLEMDPSTGAAMTGVSKSQRPMEYSKMFWQRMLANDLGLCCGVLEIDVEYWMKLEETVFRERVILSISEGVRGVTNNTQCNK